MLKILMFFNTGDKPGMRTHNCIPGTQAEAGEPGVCSQPGLQGKLLIKWRLLTNAQAEKDRRSGEYWRVGFYIFSFIVSTVMCTAWARSLSPWRAKRHMSCWLISCFILVGLLGGIDGDQIQGLVWEGSMLLPYDSLNPFTAFTTSGSSYLLLRALTEINDNFFQKVNKQFFASFSFLDSGD